MMGKVFNMFIIHVTVVEFAFFFWPLSDCTSILFLILHC